MYRWPVFAGQHERDKKAPGRIVNSYLSTQKQRGVNYDGAGPGEPVQTIDSVSLTGQ